jgi:surfeit locus 1 family protein
MNQGLLVRYLTQKRVISTQNGDGTNLKMIERVRPEMWITRLFSGKWIIVTFLVILASGVMVRLGFWQLDRLEGRRAFNHQVLEMRSLQPLAIGPGSEVDLASQVYREALVEGIYAFDYQVVLGNQAYGDKLGVHLLTPMKIEGSDKILLVDRGWVPYEDYLTNQLDQYNTAEFAQARGILSSSQDRVGIRDCLDANTNTDKLLLVWCVDLKAIQEYMPYQLEDVYLIRAPDRADPVPPIGATVQIETSEGMHLSYAVQWFSFATLLFFGYPFFVHREMKARQRRDVDSAESLVDDQ